MGYTDDNTDMDPIKFSLIVVGPLDSQRKAITGLLRIIKVKAMVVASLQCIPIYTCIDICTCVMTSCVCLY